MNRYIISYHNKDSRILVEDKINAFTMGESLNKFHQVRRGIEPETCKKVSKIENCYAPQTKEYEHFK